MSTAVASVKCTNKVRSDEAEGILRRYLDLWLKWIAPNQDLNFFGCAEKREWAVCNGIHDALVQQISLRHNTVDQFVTIRGDYAWYDVLLYGKRHMRIDAAELDRIPAKSYVIVSVPHHSGFIPNWLDQLISVCNRNGSRIFLDCAFFGTILKGRVPTNLDVFDAVAFSLSKAFLMGGCRIGIVFGDDLAPSLTRPMLPQHNYWPVNAVVTGISVLEKFPADYMPGRFKPIQEVVCKELGLSPCEVFLLGTSQDERFAQFRRLDTNYNRVCITPWIEPFQWEQESRRGIGPVL